MSTLRDALHELPDTVFADLLESDDAYLLVVDLPGVTSETIDVTAEYGSLHVEARRAKDHGPEFRYLSEERSLFLDVDIPLPPTIDAESATASLETGVLEVTLPKRTGSEGTRIEIEDA